MKIAKLFQNGQSQAVRLPKEFRIQGKEVFVKKIGMIVILIPKNNPWQPFLNSLKNISDDFMKEREQPKQQKREDLFP